MRKLSTPARAPLDAGQRHLAPSSATPISASNLPVTLADLHIGKGPMTKEQRLAFRMAIIAGATDCAMLPAEAAAFLGVSESYLRESDCPRADLGGTKYLKSQLLLFARLRLSHQLVEHVA